MALRVCLVGVGNSALALIRSLELSRLGLLNFKDSCSMPAKIAAGLNLSDIEIVTSDLPVFGYANEGRAFAS